MKTHPRAVLSLSAAALLAALAVPSSLPCQSVIRVNGPVYDGNGGPFTSGNVYWIYSDAAHCGAVVPAGRTLTIQSGAIVKVEDCFLVAGTLDATSATFTSIHDDSVGGDTAGDGGATQPQPGDWNGVDFFGGTGPSTLWGCETRYAGPSAAMDLRDRPIELTSCRFLDGPAHALVGAAEATVRNCVFRRFGDVPVKDLALRNIARFESNVATGNAKGDYAEITDGSGLSADLRMDGRHTMNGSGVFVTNVGSGSITIPIGTTLSVPLGTVWKFARGGLLVRGNLQAQGSAQDPIVFTSLLDDAHGGDTNGDGGATRPRPGDWSNLAFDTDSSGSSIVHGVICYAGDGGVPASEVRVGGATFVNTTIANNAGHAVQFGVAGTRASQLFGCDLRDNGGLPADRVPWRVVASSLRNTASGNAGGNYFRVVPEVVDRALQIFKDRYPNGALAVAGRTHLAPGGSLTLNEGVTIKFSNPNDSGFTVDEGRLELAGSAREPVFVTSFRDDAVGGDTNGDGSASQPQPGDWDSVQFRSNGAGKLEYVKFRFGGSVSEYTTSIAVQNVPTEAVRIEYGRGGMRFDDSGHPVRNAVVRNCTGPGIELRGGAFDVVHATVADNGGRGIERTGAWTGRVANSIAWNNAGGNYAGLTAGDVHHSNGGFAGQNGNRNVDPRFADPATGDLGLRADSPLIDVADLVAALATATDAEENSRIVDGGLDGSALPDMGAYERVHYRLDMTGRASIGQTLTFTIRGPGGTGGAGAVGTVVLGVQDNTAFLPPLGILLAGVSPLLELTPGGVGIGVPVPFTIPFDPRLLGGRFAFQAVGLQPGPPAVGNLTNVIRVVIGAG